ncbi:hypothetical protein RB595_004266 [Gaeumannomyces hyphopodioides]
MRRQILRVILRRWHAYLGLPRKESRSWHQDRLSEELVELKGTKSLVGSLSEASDVIFSVSRAEYEGFTDDRATLSDFLEQLSTFWAVIVVAYMLYKFTMRWSFYRVTAYACGLRGARLDAVRDVINPAKSHKLGEVAARHNLQAEEFQRVGNVVRRLWPLLP